MARRRHLNSNPNHSHTALYFFLSLVPASSLAISSHTNPNPNPNLTPTRTRTLKRATALNGSSDVDSFNITVDDATILKSSDIPLDAGDDIAGWENQTCSGCLNEPDLNKVKDRTYTALWMPQGNQFQYNLTFGFSGTAVYVYLFLSNKGTTECDFILDGQRAQQVSMRTEEQYLYNQLGFSKEGLEEKEHELVISTRGRQEEATYLGFDYAEYTRLSSAATANSTNSLFPSPSTTAPVNRHLTIKSIAGGVIGGFITVALLFIIIYYRRRKKRLLLKKRNASSGGQGYSQLENENDNDPPSYSRSSGYHGDGNGIGRGGGEVGRGGITPYYTDPFNPNPTTRELIRQERQRELNDRLQHATIQMRNLKDVYNQERSRHQQQPPPPPRALSSQQQQQQGQPQSRSLPQQRQRQRQHVYPPEKFTRLSHVPPHHSTTSTSSAPTLISHPSTPNATFNPSNPIFGPQDDLTDMRQQMQLMMDQIQSLRAEQNSTYIQGLTDEPPPGYGQVN